MSEFPRLRIANNAFSYIRDAHLDVGSYVDYLESRSIPESEYGRLEVAIDNEGMPEGAYGVYSAPDSKSQDSLHAIGLSPKHISRNSARRGVALRHETEHFIYQVNHPNHIRNRKILVGGAAALGAVMFGASGVAVGIDISHNLPLVAEIPIDTVTGAIGATLGGISFLLPAAMSHVAIGPSEIKAVWASHRRRLELPDGVLQVELA